MKKISFVLCVGVALVAMASQAEQVFVGARSVHVPLGFDSNDESEVEVVVDLPDTCHRRPFGEVKVVENSIVIDMKANKMPSNSGIYCIQAIVPVLVTVPVGRLAEGSYNVVVSPSFGTEKDAHLTVAAPTTSSIDNFTYANVTNIKKGSDGSTVYLEGYHPSSCMEIDQVKMIPNESGDTIAVLPIVRQAQAVCDTMIKPFEYPIQLVNVASSEVVLHVRKIDGHAINFKL
jgi:hypothetical protein